MNIELGRIYKDAVSGFEGYAIGIQENITSCDQVGLMKQVKGDLKADSFWFDVTRLTLVGKKKLPVLSTMSYCCADPILGARYKDALSGFEGVAVTIEKYYHGGLHVGLTDNKASHEVFEVNRLQRVGKKVVELPRVIEVKKEKSKGPGPAPKKPFGIN